MDANDPIMEKALWRYQVISAYLAADPPRGKRGQMLEHLAQKTWMLPCGDIVRVKAETIRYWIRQYRNRGFEALKDKVRSSRQNRAIPEDVIESACRLKREVPERTIDRIITIMENMQMAPPGMLRRSTLHRALKARGLSARKLTVPANQDLDRFEADYANDLWQSDMLQGPWLPDPQRPGKMRRAHLYAFSDDASRLLLYGRFFFKGDLPALELVFRRALQRYGRPKRVYYDNAKVYRAHHMRLICAELGIDRPIYTQPYRPMGHGKIEAFNRFCINNFIAEVKASHVRTLDQLNQAFFVWVDQEYNQRTHSSLGCSPKQRWLKDASRIQYLDEESIRVAFLWRELRTADKTGVITLFNRKYKVSPALAKKRLQIRYDPQRLEMIEIYLDGAFKQRAKPLQITPHRAPQQVQPAEPVAEKPTDYLGWLTQNQKVPSIDPASDKTKQQLFLDIFQQRLDEKVYDPDLILEFYQTYGPFDAEKLQACLDHLLCSQPANLHISFYLNHIKDRMMGG